MHIFLYLYIDARRSCEIISDIFLCVISASQYKLPLCESFTASLISTHKNFNTIAKDPTCCVGIFDLTSENRTAAMLLLLEIQS